MWYIRGWLLLLLSLVDRGGVFALLLFIFGWAGVDRNRGWC